MAVEMIQDLALHQPPAGGEAEVTKDKPFTPDELDGVRCYLGYFHLTST